VPAVLAAAFLGAAAFLVTALAAAFLGAAFFFDTGFVGAVFFAGARLAGVTAGSSRRSHPLGRL
jgi:hypothetical protein